MSRKYALSVIYAGTWTEEEWAGERNRDMDFSITIRREHELVLNHGHTTLSNDNGN